MNRFQTVVGIDPSGRRLALAAVRGGFGRPSLCAPPFVCELRGEKEQQLLSEVEGPLGDYVARNGLMGSAARLCVPADRVYSARVVFPPPDVEALIKLASGDWEVGAPTDDGEITMDLPMRPVAPVRLLVVCYEGTEVTGVHGVILDPIDLFTD